MNRTKSLALVAVAATTALTLAACGGGGSSSSKSSGGSSGSTGAVLPNTAWAKASYDQVKQGGTLVQAVSQLPINWNSNQTNGPLGDNTTIESPALLGGVIFKPDGTWQVDTNVVESAKVAWAGERPSGILNRFLRAISGIATSSA